MGDEVWPELPLCFTNACGFLVPAYNAKDELTMKFIVCLKAVAQKVGHKEVAGIIMQNLCSKLLP